MPGFAQGHKCGQLFGRDAWALRGGVHLGLRHTVRLHQARNDLGLDDLGQGSFALFLSAEVIGVVGLGLKAGQALS
jgi:hypothetical protein